MSLGSGVVVEVTTATGGRSGESPERSKATSLCSEGVVEVIITAGGSGTSSVMSKENIPDSVVGVELITAGGKSKSG